MKKTIGEDEREDEIDMSEEDVSQTEQSEAEAISLSGLDQVSQLFAILQNLKGDYIDQIGRLRNLDAKKRKEIEDGGDYEKSQSSLDEETLTKPDKKGKGNFFLSK